MKRYIWIKTTSDEYEFILEMGDTVQDLANKCGVSANTIHSAIAHAKAKGKQSQYKKVAVKDHE